MLVDFGKQYANLEVQVYSDALALHFGADLLEMLLLAVLVQSHAVPRLGSGLLLMLHNQFVSAIKARETVVA